MKNLLITALVLLVAVPVFAQLTTEEETFVSNLYNNRQKLIDLYNRSTELSALADNTTSETLPLEIAKLRQQRVNLIETRDTEKDAVKAQAIIDVNVIDVTYEPQIDSLESQIQLLEAQLEALIP